ncbi:MAG: PAS domain S-box protein [Bacteroidetes bacterium]|nr:PAS domain S-box protein [Bacteroidota bacterium]
MNTKINILVIEDSNDDALLVLREIQKANYIINNEIVASADLLKESLKKINWDIVVSDYVMPGFSGLDALKIVREFDEDLPFIIVSGTIGESIAVDAMRSGANDYVMKNSLARLVPAIKRELREAVIRRERKIAKDKLKESEELYRALVETSPEAIVLIDACGNILFSNKQGANLIGEKYVHNLKNRNVFEFIFPEDLEKANSNLIRANEGDVIDDQEIRLMRADKNIIYTEIRVAPLLDSSGKPKFLIFMIIDVTKKIEGIKKRLKSEAEFRSVWENSFDAMRLCDENGIIVRVNRAFCKMMNRTREELEGKRFDVIYNSENDHESLEKYKYIFHNHTVQPKLETEINLIDKKKIWVELSNSYIEIKGQPTLLLSIFRDISERKNYENSLIIAKEKAEEMNRMKSNFMNNMSHEIRTPMVAILGYAQLVLDELENADPYLFLKGIVSSGRRLMETINSILDLSRIESGKIELKFKKINLVSESKEIIERLSILAEQKGLYIKFSAREDSILSLLDSNLYDQIVENLIGNAIKYTEKGGIIVEITKNYIEEENWSVLNIIDTGIGIPKESLEIIFEEFRQVSEGIGRRFEGSGLGLTITKKYVEMMHGKISVESRFGRGSVFSVRFKSCLPDEIEFESKIFQKEFPKTIIGKEGNIKPNLARLLLVENDSGSINITRRFLKGLYELDCVEKGEDAIELVKNKKYDLILMDINLGYGKSGVETTLEIKNISGYENIPIVALTAYAMHSDKEYFLSIGLTHYLAKPFEKSDLINLIEQILHSSNKDKLI